MKRLISAALVAAVFASSAWAAASPTISPDLAGLSFLVGLWNSGKGVVAETGGTSTGASTITLEANGAALLRRDHTNLFDKAGKPAGGFDQIMLIYPDAKAIHADYTDGTHVIHYTGATIVPGKSVTFTTTALPSAPSFQLTYTLTDAETLSISFAMAPPGQTQFNPIATGSVTRAH